LDFIQHFRRRACHQQVGQAGSLRRMMEPPREWVVLWWGFSSNFLFL